MWVVSQPQNAYILHHTLSTSYYSKINQWIAQDFVSLTVSAQFSAANIGIFCSHLYFNGAGFAVCIRNQSGWGRSPALCSHKRRRPPRAVLWLGYPKQSAGCTARWQWRKEIHFHRLSCQLHFRLGDTSASFGFLPSWKRRSARALAQEQSSWEKKKESNKNISVDQFTLAMAKGIAEWCDIEREREREREERERERDRERERRRENKVEWNSFTDTLPCFCFKNRVHLPSVKSFYCLRVSTSLYNKMICWKRQNLLLNVTRIFIRFSHILFNLARFHPTFFCFFALLHKEAQRRAWSFFGPQTRRESEEGIEEAES